MQGHLAKMKVALAAPVEYQLPIDDDRVSMNKLIGQTITLKYNEVIHCVSCGRKTSKSYAQGHCYPCFMSLAECDMCIMKPETCHFAAGTCREPEWAMDHCMQPHYVYLANSSGVKVGITRGNQIPTRWIDQGASQALPIFKVQNRLQSGLIEVELKKHISDRTDWRKMLKGEPEPVELSALRNELVEQSDKAINKIIKKQGADSVQFLADEKQVEINYPVNEYPEKVKSFNFDKQAKVTGTLNGIKGQYLIFDTGVLNIRKFSGYNISLKTS